MITPNATKRQKTSIRSTQINKQDEYAFEAGTDDIHLNENYFKKFMDSMMPN